MKVVDTHFDVIVKDFSFPSVGTTVELKLPFYCKYRAANNMLCKVFSDLK